MTTRQSWLGGVAVVLGMTAVASASQASNAAACARALENPRVAVSTVNLSSVAALRVYFRAESQSGDYYVEMRKGATEAWAVLPRTSADTSAVVYRVVGIGLDGREIAVSSGRIPVSGTCLASRLSVGDAGDAANLVIGQTADQQRSIPPGFLCDGITSLISALGEMRGNQSCQDLVASDARNPVVRTDTRNPRGVVVRGEGRPAVKPVSASRP